MNVNLPSAVAKHRKLIVVVCFAVAAFAQQTGSIAGTWVALHRSQGGIGSLWEFKDDGSLRMGVGAIVDTPYKLEGDKLILPPGTTGPAAKPQVTRIKIEGDTMTEIPEEPGAVPRKFTRVGHAKSGRAPIVGTWRPVVADTPGTEKDPLQAAQKDATYTYTQNGMLKLRMPFSFVSGSYDAAAHTFTLDYHGRTVKGKYRVDGEHLFLSQPDGKKEDEYLKDTEE